MNASPSSTLPTVTVSPSTVTVIIALSTSSLAEIAVAVIVLSAVATEFKPSVVSIATVPPVKIEVSSPVA